MKTLILLSTFIFLWGTSLSAEKVFSEPNPMSNMNWNEDPSELIDNPIDINVQLTNFGQVAAFVKTEKKSKGMGMIQGMTPQVDLKIHVNSSEIVHFYIFDNDPSEETVYPAQQALVYDYDNNTVSYINYITGDVIATELEPDNLPTLELSKSLDKPIVILESNGAVCPDDDMETASLYIFGRGNEYTYQITGQNIVDEDDDGLISKIHMLNLFSSTDAYAVTVIIDDNTNSEVVRDVMIEELTTPSLTEVIQNVNCEGLETLTINAADADVYNFENNLFTLVSGTTNMFTFDATLISSTTTYDFTLTNTTTGCSTPEQEVTINPYVPVSFQLVGPLADNGSFEITCDGSVPITLTPAGTASPYQYSIDGGTTFSDNITNSPPTLITIQENTNSVIVKDSDGCIEEQLIQVTDNSLSITLREGTIDGSKIIDGEVNILCHGGDTTIYLEAPDDIDNYSFTINGGAPIDNNDLGIPLFAGDYVINLTNNDDGCSTTTPLMITEPTNLMITTDDVIHACGGTNTGQIQTNVVGGTGAYTYTWNFNSVFLNSGNNLSNISGLEPGSYALTVTDDYGCEDMANFDINESLTLTLSDNIINPTCDGATDGIITVSAGGGTPQYTYTLTNTSIAPITSDSEVTFEGLANGTYNLMITDDNNCTSNTLHELNGPELPAPEITINPSVICADAPATIIAEHAVSGVSYTWTHPDGASYGSDNQVLEIENVQDTTFECIADFQGCESMIPVVIETEKFPLPDSIDVDSRDNTNTYVSNVTVTEGDWVCLSFDGYEYNENDTYFWQFRDGGWSEQDEPCHYFNIPGEYPVYMEVTTEDGCVFEFNQVKLVTVEELPEREQGLNTEDESVFAVIFPNPFIDQLTLMLETDTAGQWDIVLKNSLGQHIHAMQIQTHEGLNQIPIDYTNQHLSNGLYTIQVSNGDKYQVLKIIKNTP